MLYASTFMYVGSFISTEIDGLLGSKSGTGTQVNFQEDGSLLSFFEGEWLMNKQNGQGTMHYADGSKETGNWEDDEKVGDFVYTSANGTEEVKNYVTP